MMEDRHIFTDSHAKSILTTMNNLRKMDKLCDVCLKVEDKRFPAHRIVLAACSDYFCAMFTGNLSEKDQEVVELHEISAEVMEVLLDFVYTETVNVSVENVQELLPAACLLQLTGVKQACCSFLEKQLDHTNCLGIKIFAEQHCCDVLWTAAESYSLRHFQEVIENDEFKSLPLEELERLISSNELQVSSEEQVFEAVMMWVKHDSEARKNWLASLMRHIRLPLLTARYITDVVDNEVFVKRCHECRDLLDEAKKFHLRPDLRSQMVGPRMQTRSGTDDVLVVVGGFGAHQNMVEVVEQYDPKTDQWTSLPNLTRRRRYVAAAAVNGKVYVVGGYDGQARLNAVECLDVGAEEPAWRTVAPMSQRRGLAGVTVYKGQLYVCGGFDGYTRHHSMECYSPHMDSWSTLSGMEVGREGAGLVVAGDTMYCIGGYDGLNLLDSAEQYDIKNDEWSPIANMATKRSADESEVRGKWGKGKKTGTRGKQPATVPIASICQQQALLSDDEFELDDDDLEFVDEEVQVSFRGIEQQQIENGASSPDIKAFLATNFGAWIPNSPAFDGSMPSSSTEHPQLYCSIIPGNEWNMEQTSAEQLAWDFANSSKLLHAYISRLSEIWTPTFRPFPGSVSPCTSRYSPMPQKQISVHDMNAQGSSKYADNDGMTADRPQTTGIMTRLKKMANSITALPSMMKGFMTSAPTALPSTEL